jgi:hypothetical protein
MTTYSGTIITPPIYSGASVAVKNLYATLNNYKAYKTARNQTAGLSTDTADDAVISQLLQAASRYVDMGTGKVFYPFIQERTFDTPDNRELCLDENLLEVLSITNGDGTTITAGEYYLVPANKYPISSIKIYDSSIYYWTMNPNNSAWEQAVTVNAIWGYHNDYAQNGWIVGGKLSEDLDTSEVDFDVDSTDLFEAGQTIRYGNELSNILTKTVGQITVISRGENGSTAVTHTSGDTIYIWQPMPDLKNHVCEMVKSAYDRRFGESGSNTAIITGAGVVLTPRDVPAMAAEFIMTHRNRL